MHNARHHNLSRLIDHTLLRPEAVENDYLKLCTEALGHGFFAVCVPPFFVSLARDCLKNTDVKVCTVVGFPFGYSSTECKVNETQWAISSGADELDMVINIAALKSKRLAEVSRDVSAVARASSGRLLKVILECSLLSTDEIVTACQICEDSGAEFIKTSTGFGPHGARVEDVALIKKSISSKTRIKASGGIRDRETALALVAAGAARLGTSRSVEIVNAI